MAHEPFLKSQSDRGPQTLSIDDVEHATIRSAIDYWRSVCGNRQFPARSDLTLRGLAVVLPYSLIVAVLDGGTDYEFRFVGDAECQAFKRNFKGMRITDVERESPDFGKILRATYERVRSSGTPFIVRGMVDHKPLIALLPYHESVFLPLGSAGSVDHILIVGVSVPWSRRREADTLR